MCKLIAGVHVLLTLSLAASTAAADDYAGYLSVNDEDYGYWQGRPMVWVGEHRLPLDEHAGSSHEIAFELEHDLAQGLVRQYTRQKSAVDSGVLQATVSETAHGTAGGRDPSEPPRGEGTWVFLYEFDSFGFGQYEGSDATHHLYCDRAPSVWAWLAGGATEGASPDDVADRVIKDERGKARLKFDCDREMAVTD